jgi:MFS family permease
VLFLWLLGVIAGPLLGFALVFTALPPWAINFFGSLVFALLLPYLALARTLLYLDLAARKEQVAGVPAGGLAPRRPAAA